MNDDLVEKCLRIMCGPMTWNSIKNEWPDAAIQEKRRKMSDVIAECTFDAALEARRLSGCLLAISGAEGCGNGALRTAAYEAAANGIAVADLASKLKLPAPFRVHGSDQ